MYSTSPTEILHGYSVVRASLVDDHHDQTVPVGVVAWDAPARWYDWRWLETDEKVRGIDGTTRKLMGIVRKQIQRWANARKVPYEPELAEPTSTNFWKAVSEVLTTAVRLDPPKAMDPMEEPGAEIESLFEAVVRPAQPRARRTRRIDTALKEALRELADIIPPRPQVSAFGGAREQVRRGVETDRSVLLVDGVNLAAANARKEADAFVSRLMRIRAAYENGQVHIVVGYSASPGGLNDEAHMREWIQARLTDRVFDMVTQNADFRKAAADAWSELGADPPGALPMIAGEEDSAPRARKGRN